MSFYEKNYQIQEKSQKEFNVYRSFYFQMNEILNRYNTKDFPEKFIEEVKELNEKTRKEIYE